MNTSATGGPLLPGSQNPFSFDSPLLSRGWDRGIFDPSAPAAGVPLWVYLQQFVVNVSGLPGELVRPRWQQVPGNLPDVNTDWVAFGVTRRTSEAFPAILLGETADGNDYFYTNELVELMASFYGPNAEFYADQARDGMKIPQNQEYLLTGGWGWVGAEEITTLPSLINQRWYYRVDLPFRLRRQIARVYPVLPLVEADVRLNTSSGYADNVNITLP